MKTIKGVGLIGVCSVGLVIGGSLHVASIGLGIASAIAKTGAELASSTAYSIATTIQKTCEDYRTSNE